MLFERIFIEFSYLQKRFLNGCRRLIGLYGCFLKGEVSRMLLSPIGKDGNNQMFPIFRAIVEGENKDSWNWFIQLVQEQLQMDDGTCWSVILDQ